MLLGHNRKMTGAQCLADMLKGYGVTHVFHVPAVLRTTYAEMERRTDIKRLHVHGEKAAAYMADGYARASGKPGICMAQVIGALNLAAGLRDAWLAHSPVIAMTGGREPKTKFRKVYQEIDDVPAFEPVTKFNATVDDVARFPDMVRQAFRTAVTGCPGPVHLQFRGNEGQIDAEEAEMEPLCEPQFARVPAFRPEPDEASVRAALKILQDAARPVIVAGGGVRASGAAAELVALAEALQIPVATSLNGKDSIPGNHPLSVGVVGTYSRESANRVVNAADLVCFIGTETGGMTTHFWAVPKIGTPAIQIDIDPEALGRNYPLAARVNGDAKVTLARMLGLCRSRERRQAQGLGRRGAENLRRVARQIRSRAQFRRGADPAGAALPRTDAARSRRCHRRRRHRPCRHVDGRHVRSDVAAAELYAQRRPSRLGVPGRARRQMRVSRAAGRHLHRRCRVLVPHRRDRDRGALEHQCGDGGQQQRRRQSVKRGFDRVYGGKQTEQGARTVDISAKSISPASPRTWARSASASNRPSAFPAALAQALAADRPVVIDVVTDIDALAPVAVS